ncbi:MAG: hypothetical protein Kow0069_24540 [Promethearchaeota archaeon]
MRRFIERVAAAGKVIASGYCPSCGRPLVFDDQKDSIYAYCQCDAFNFNGFKDLESGRLVLAYLTGDLEGTVDPAALRELERALSRRASFAQS